MTKRRAPGPRSETIPGVPLKPSFVSLTRAVALTRLHLHRFGPSQFNPVGPIHRFDHHTQGSRAKPERDPDRATLYAASNLWTALLEIYAYTPVIDPSLRRAATLRSKEAIRLLDIRGSNALGAGVTTAMNGSPRRTSTQAFARRVYAHPAFGQPEGIVYSGAVDGRDNYVFFERAANKLEVVRDVELRSLEFVGVLGEFAHRFGKELL